MTPDLSPDLLPIAKLLDRPRPQVLIVVGTGVAINATGCAHASWLGLLKHGIRHLVQKQFRPGWGVELEASLEAAFSPFNLQSALQHANLVEQALNTPDDKAFAQWLESAFANFKPRNEEKAKAPLQVLRDLHEAGALLLTTNYDSLLSDITGVAPVTWEEHAEFHRVMTRQKAGILHLHGHWQRPSSIVLGRSSYDRVVADTGLQQLFRTLWLDWSWIYVGCGDGLDDPNLGCLLEWSKGWGESGLPDFFLARDDKAKDIATRPSKPPNLQAIGYGSHDALPVVLRSVTPAARCWPFVPVDDSFPLFHLPGASDPFPSRQDYLDGTVPAFAADAELLARLQTHGWACCIDVASVGKTTLALRVASTPEQRAHPVFYLDLKRELEDDADASPVAAVGRLARAGTLLILDNSHYQPELARQLWQQWHAKPAESRGRLLLIATRIHQPVVVTPEQDLMFFERHPINPAILLQPTPEDLGRLAKHLYRRIGGAKCPPMPEPPVEVLADWHATYRAALNAFTFAVLDTLADFQKSKWTLPPTRASAWVRKHWLSKLDAPELENAICLAAFGSQELEMRVPDIALPQPGKLEKLFELGLVSQSLRGQFNQYRQFELREPGWGRLILAALTPSVDEEEILFATASRNLLTAIVLSSRLRLEGDKVRFKRLWAYLAARADQLVKQLWDVPLSYLQHLHLLAKVGDQPQLLARFWEAIETDLDAFAASAWATSLEHVGSFLNVAKQHGRDTAPMWALLESEPDKFAASAWASSLHHVASFINVAKQQGRDTAPLWAPLESEPDKFAASAWSTSLEHVGSFLNVAKQQGRDTAPLWALLESEPDKFAASAWSTSLEHVGSFLNVAKQQGRDTAPLWALLESQPDKFAASAWSTSLNNVGSFLNVAKQQGRDTAPLWAVLESQPDKFAASAFGTSLHDVGSLFKCAKMHGITTDKLERVLEADLRQLASGGYNASIRDLISFGGYVSDKLLEVALLDIKPGHWRIVPISQGMCGATWLIMHCRRLNRIDLAEDLLTLLLQRANWRDFPPQSGGYAQVCWLLANVPAGELDLVQPFLSAVCTEKWLQIAYTATASGQLAAGLRQLALNQPVERCQQFHHRGLGGRLFNELERFSEATPRAQSEAIQLLGCSNLCGWAISQRSLGGITHEAISQLPLNILPHNPEVARIDDHQWQLWLGLRAFVSIKRERLRLPSETIEQTLNLWRANLEETVAKPATTAHRVNQSMVRWLETCSRENLPALLPSSEPLWSFVGFPTKIVPNWSPRTGPSPRA